MRYLLDTNTCIHAMRGVVSVLQAMATHRPRDLAVSSVSCYELYTGVEKCKRPDQERGKVDTLLRTVRPIAFDMAASVEAALVRAELESRGEIIGPYDVLIAGHAIANGLRLVSSNTKEFARVPKLTLEDWSAVVR